MDYFDFEDWLRFIAVLLATGFSVALGFVIGGVLGIKVAEVLTALFF